MTKTQKRFVVFAVLSAFVLLPGVAKAQNLIAHWPMDDANDAISSTPGTLEGGASIVDGALVLDGVDDRLATNVAAPTPNGVDGWTVAAWIQTSTTGIYWANKPPGDSVDGDQLIFRLDSDTVLEGDMEGVAYITSSDAPAPITDGEWHHVVLSTPSSSAISASWYLDGAVLNSDAGNVAEETLPDGSVVFIGWGTDTSSVNDYFTGSIDDVRIYDDALDAAAVQALFDAGRDAGGGGGGGGACDAVICDFEDQTDCGDWYGGDIVTDTWDASSSYAWASNQEDGYGINPDVIIGASASVGFWVKYSGGLQPTGGYFYNEVSGGDHGGDFTITPPASVDTWEFITVSTDPDDWDGIWHEGTMNWGAPGDVAFVISFSGTGGTVTIDDICGVGSRALPPGDADGDGFLDSVEVALGYDPNDAGDAPPATPVAGLLGLGLLSLGVLAGGAALVRRKK